MEIGIIEGAIILILNHYKAHFNLCQKIAHLFLRNLHNLKSTAFVQPVKVSNQGVVYFF